MTIPPTEDLKAAIERRVEGVVRDHFYPGPLAGSTARLTAALVEEFGLARLGSGEGVVEVCFECDIADCHHIKARKAALSLHQASGEERP